MKRLLRKISNKLKPLSETKIPGRSDRLSGRRKVIWSKAKDQNKGQFWVIPYPPIPYRKSVLSHGASTVLIPQNSAPTATCHDSCLRHSRFNFRRIFPESFHKQKYLEKIVKIYILWIRIISPNYCIRTDYYRWVISGLKKMVRHRSEQYHSENFHPPPHSLLGTAVVCRLF